MRKLFRSIRLPLFTLTLVLAALQATPAAQANYCWREGDCWVCCDYCCSMACPWADYQWC